MAKVLIVDDVHDNVKLLAYDLADEGYEVVLANNGPQALDLAASELPDVILLDVMIPEMDGIDVCRRLKADHELRHIPVIMVSALGKDADIVRGLDGGALDYVTKPFSFPVVLARIRSAVRIKIDHDTIEEMNQQLDAARRMSEDASKSKSEFLANMSHEIRTPMTAILGYADQLLEEGEIENAPQVRIDAINTIRRNGKCLLDLINDILDLSKIEAGKTTVERIDCEPCRIVADVASLMRPRATSKGLAFNFEYVGPIPKAIQSDPVRLRQILLNLVGNAIKFTEAGTVRLRTRVVERGTECIMQFDVIDTGCGLTDTHLANLFHPFTQADASTTRKYGGTGLGLTICKRFVEMLGGDLSVPKTQIDAGSTFRATVETGSLDGVTMLTDPMAATIVDYGDDSPARFTDTDLQGLRILLAEDGLDNQRLIVYFLQKAGAHVTAVENGQLAFDAGMSAAKAGHPFDAILMDMQMPILDGYRATRRLRESGYAGPIIALTAHAMDGDREKCINAGCNDFVTKPVNRKVLIDVITAHVDRKRSKTQTAISAVAKPSTLTGYRILLAEDNPTNQVLVAGILRQAGADVTTVKDGKLAFDAATAQDAQGSPFDTILMDIQMPLLGGDEATKLLRKNDYTGTIIALTAHALACSRDEILDIGFDDCATKPIDRTALIETILQHLAPPAISH